MILTYSDILGDGKEHTIKAEVTTDHPCSHYGIPVIVLDNGYALDLQSWVMLGYRVKKASEKEKTNLKKVFSNFSAMAGGPVSEYLAEIGSKGGKKSKRTLSPEQAKNMVKTREKKKKAKDPKDG